MCWINTIYDNYKDTLLSLNKRNVITRESILQIINISEDNIKDGLSIEDMLPFFKKYSLSVRIFDAFYKLIFKYDPEKRNHNNKVLYCMMNDNHIYTINQNALSLQHISEDEEPNEYLVYASNDYHVKENEAIYNFMIDTIDDILEIAKSKITLGNCAKVTDMASRTATRFLIHKSNNLIDLLYECIAAGYKPGIGFTCGNV